MRRLSIVQNQPYNQAGSYTQFNPVPAPNTQYQPIPARPQPSLQEILHNGSGVVSLIALATAIFGGKEARETATECLRIALPVFNATAPAQAVPPPPPVAPVLEAIRTAPVSITELRLQQQVQELQHKVAELTRQNGEACRQLAVTQAELALVRVAVLGDFDDP